MTKIDSDHSMQNRRRYRVHETFIFFQNEKSHALNYANSCKLINRLTDPATKVDKSTSKQPTSSPAKPINGPSSLPGPFPPDGSPLAIDLSLPAKPFVGYFICVRVHGYPTCVPSFCKKDQADRHQRWLYRKPRSD